MDESATLRRSARKSVVSKTDDTLTPKKKSVNIEHGTPSRRTTRASSATPKKSLAETFSTPKKSLAVLKENDEETPTKRTALKLNGNTGTPKRNVNNKLSGNSRAPPSIGNIVVDSEKINDKPEETVVTGRPLTRAKRKTMTEKMVTEIQNVNPETEKNSHLKKPKQITKSDLKQEVVSCSALVPKVVLTELLRDNLKEANKAEKSGINNDCSEDELKDSYKSKSPLKAEEISTTTPSKFSDDYKSNSETSLMSIDSITTDIKMSPVGSARKYLEFESKSPSKPDEEAAKSPVSGTIINTGTPEKLLDSENIHSTSTSNSRPLIKTESHVNADYISMQGVTVINENSSPHKDKQITGSEESILETSTAKDNPVPECDSSPTKTKDDIPSSEYTASITKLSSKKDSEVVRGSQTKTEHVAQLDTKNIRENISTPADDYKSINEAASPISKTSPSNDSEVDLKISPTKDEGVHLESKKESSSMPEDKGMNKSEASVTNTSPNNHSDVCKRSPLKAENVEQSMETINICENPLRSADNNKSINEVVSSITKTSPNKPSDIDLEKTPSKDRDATQLESINENSSSEDDDKGMNKSGATVTNTSLNNDSDVCKGSPFKTVDLEQTMVTKNICENSSMSEDNNKSINEVVSSFTITSPNKSSDGNFKISPSKDRDATQLESINENPSSSEDDDKGMNKSEASVTISSPNNDRDVVCKTSPLKTENVEQTMETRNICENSSTTADNNKDIDEFVSSITKTSPNKASDFYLKKSPSKDRDGTQLESINENSSSEDDDKSMNKSEASVTISSPNNDRDVVRKTSPLKTQDVQEIIETTVPLDTINIHENISTPADNYKGINEVASLITISSPNKDNEVVHLESKKEKPSSSEDNNKGMNKSQPSVMKTSLDKDKDVDCTVSTINTDPIEHDTEDALSENCKIDYDLIKPELAFDNSQMKSRDDSSLRKRRIVDDDKELKTECINNDNINNKSDLSIVETCFEDSKSNKVVESLVECQIKAENESSPYKRKRLVGEMPSQPFSKKECAKKNYTMYKLSPSKQRILEILDNVTLFPDIEGTDSDNSELVIDEDNVSMFTLKNDASSQGLKDNSDCNNQGERIRVLGDGVVDSSTEIDAANSAKSEGLMEIFSAQSATGNDQINPTKSPYLDSLTSTKTNESMLTTIAEDKSLLKQTENINEITSVDISRKNHIHLSDEKNIKQLCEESRLETVSNATRVKENLKCPPHKAEADKCNSKDELDEFLMSPKDFLNSDEESVICDEKSADTNVKVQRNVECESDVIVAEIDSCEKESVDSCKQNENSPKTSVTSEDSYVIDESDSLFMRDLIKKKCEGTFPKPSPHDNKSSDLDVEMGNSSDDKSTNNGGNNETSPVVLDLDKLKKCTATIITDVKSKGKKAYPIVSESDESERSKSNDSDNDFINDVEGDESSAHDDVSGKDFINFEAEEGEESSVHDDISDNDFINDDEGDESSAHDDVSGKDFINFEAEEGEEFVHDIDSAASSNSSRKKRKMSTVTLSSETDNENSVVVMIASSDEEVVSSKNKKQKLGRSKKKSTIKEPAKSDKGQINDRIEEKTIREVTKTAVFIVSRIDKDSETSESSKNPNKKQSDAVSRGFTVTEINSDQGTKKLKRKIKKKITSPYEVVLVLPSETNSKTIKKEFKKVGIRDILSINFVNPKVATLGLSTEDSFKKVLDLYGKLMIDNQPVYTLEPTSF